MNERRGVRALALIAAVTISLTTLTACEQPEQPAQIMSDSSIVRTDLANVDRIPLRILERPKPLEPKSVVTPGLTWTKPVISVAFYGGNSDAYALIEDAAMEWITDESPITFSFRSNDGQFREWSPNDVFGSADIRIAFSDHEEDKGYWSVTGEEALDVPGYWQTMNFENFDTRLAQYYGQPDHPDWLTSFDRGTIIHEFGHALAISHEHFHRDCQAVLDVDEAVRHYVAEYGWDEKQARYQVDANHYFGTFGDQHQPDFSPTIDQSSIMLYSEIASFADGQENSSCALKVSGNQGFAYELSNGDRRAFREYYPPDSP